MQSPNIPGGDTYGLSDALWAQMPMEKILAGDRNLGYGFFDDFLRLSDTTLEDGYIKVQTTNATVAQVASTGNTATTGIGICRLHVTAEDNSEAVISWGNGLDAPFKPKYTDLCFECRVSLDNLTTSSHGFFIGLGSIGCGVTVQCITQDDAIYAGSGATNGNFLGFQQLKAETSAVDGMYQMYNQTKQDGAVQTKLDTLATLVASTYVKLGFRYKALDNTLHWFVDGVEVEAAMLTSAQLLAATFPDTLFMTPVACIVDDATTAASLDIDWWACAQLAV